jgi:multicomponent Na+:H+ antiporter subunit E
MKSLALNLAIAVMWLLLSAKPSVSSFAVGFAAGFGLLAAFQSIVGSGSYVRRVLAFLRFLLRFTVEFLRANAKVAWAVLFRSRRSFRPDFVRYDTSELTHAEILLLSYCVSLTPGTTTVEISEDFKTLTFHALDADRPDALRSEIDRTLKHGILAFTR